MDTQTLRFTFERDADREAIEDDIGLALFTASCLYGLPSVRLGARYLVSDDGSRCVASIAGTAGDAVLRIFTGLCASRLGEDGFRIERIGGAAC
ncbi:MAG: hypothetical protein AB7I38_03740 [Dehalococcoidia bacterium]